MKNGSASTSEPINVARFCVENPHITWALLIGTVIWGIYGYFMMPQRKDPDIPLKVALVETPWPGASAEKVEELVTKTIEKTIASNTKISKIDSTSRSGDSVITFSVSDDLKDASQVLDDIGGRLAGIRNLPDGAGPINYQRDFGDTATLMLTVASPRSSGSEIDLRAAKIREAIESVRVGAPGSQLKAPRASLVFCFPPRETHRLARYGAAQFADYLGKIDQAIDARLFDVAGCIGVDMMGSRSDEEILGLFGNFLRERYPQSLWEPDTWPPFVVRDLADARVRLVSVAGDKYSYHELDQFTDVMEKALLATGRKDVDAPLVAKVSRSGVLAEKIYVVYSQERLASHGFRPGSLSGILRDRNLTVGGGSLQR